MRSMLVPGSRGAIRRREKDPGPGHQRKLQQGYADRPTFARVSRITVVGMEGTTAVDSEDRPRPLVSVVVVLLSLAAGLGLLYGVLQDGPSGPMLVLDVAVGAVCSAALWWRHRAPVAIGVGTAVAASVFATAGAANMFALYAVARRRPLRVALALGVLDVAAGLAFYALYPGNSSWTLTVTVNVAISAAAVAWVRWPAPSADWSDPWRNGLSVPRPSSACERTGSAAPSGSGSRARCTTSWPTGCHWSPCMRVGWR